MREELASILRLARRIGRRLARSDKARLGIASATMIVGAVLTSMPALILGSLVNETLENDQLDLSSAAPYLMLVGLAVVGRQCLEVLRRYLVERTGTGVERDVRHELVSHLTKLPLPYFLRHRSGEINSRVNRGVEGYVKVLKLGFMDLLPTISLAVIAVGAALTRNVQLGVLMSAVIPVGFFLVLLQIRSEKGIRLDIKATKERMDGTTHEILDGIESIRGLAAEPFAVHQLAQDLDRAQRVELRHHLRMSLFDAAKFGNEGLFQVLVIAAAVVLASEGKISAGDVLTAALLFGSIVAPLRELHRILDEAHESTLHAADVFAVLDEETSPAFAHGDEEPWQGGLGDASRPLIEIRGVTFSYEGAGQPAVQGVDLEVAAGEFLGFCGASRCGKSTLLRLLGGLYAPSTGSVIIDGVDLWRLDPITRAGLIGYVPQTPWLFHGTVRENISCGLPVSELEVRAAAERAQIDADIVEMADGYDTLLTEKGANLSGGQRQRLALARVLVRKPRILLLDEATSALDNVTEQHVMASLTAEPGLTMIAVAHRLTTLRDADRVALMDRGRIIESGAFDYLYESRGRFRDLVDAGHNRAEVAA